MTGLTVPEATISTVHSGARSACGVEPGLVRHVVSLMSTEDVHGWVCRIFDFSNLIVRKGKIYSSKRLNRDI